MSDVAVPKERKRDDAAAKEILLKKWPAVTKKLFYATSDDTPWIRAQPRANGMIGTPPRIVLPGSTLFKTQPDGLYVQYKEGGLYCDVVAIEISSNVSNVRDKRSRYAATTTSKVLETDAKWLQNRVTDGGRGKELISTLSRIDASRGKIISAIRFIRVLITLEKDQYVKWIQNDVPRAHEYFIPRSSLSSITSPQMRIFLQNLTLFSHFYSWIDVFGERKRRKKRTPVIVEE